MKKLLIFFSLLIGLICHVDGENNFKQSDIFKSMQQGDKAALLIVHFGTTYDDTRNLTIEAINAKITNAFSGITVREAYTSRIIINRLKQREIVKLTPTEALLALKDEGYTHVLIQSTNIIEGIEMEALRREVENMESSFKDIRIGNPLLYSVEDYEKVVSILGNQYAGKGAVVLVGHGTYTPATATYSMLEYMLKDKGYKQIYVGTIEGYPSFDSMLRLLKSNKEKQVILVPFMFVAGDHANNDIATDWKKLLEKEGFNVTVSMKGLGENLEIQNLFTDHAHFISTHKMIKILDKKKRYSTGK